MKANTSLLRIPTNNCLASQQEGKRMIWCVITWFCMCMFGFSASMLWPPGCGRSTNQKGRFSPGARRPRPLGTQPPSPTPVTDSLMHPASDRWKECCWHDWRHEAGDACYLQPLKKAGGRVGGKCVRVCVCVPECVPSKEENHNSVLWFSWHILSVNLVNGDHREQS